MLNLLYPGRNLNLAQTAVSPAQEKRGLRHSTLGCEGPPGALVLKSEQGGGGGERECCL